MRNLVFLMVALFCLSGCPMNGFAPPKPSIKSSVYQAVQKKNINNPNKLKGYGLYSYLLIRESSENNLNFLSELFRTTLGTNESEIMKENMNLILIPVLNEWQANLILESVRLRRVEVAKKILLTQYDYGYAQKLYSIVCQNEQKKISNEACGELTDAGPFIITTTYRIGDHPDFNQPMLIVNLTNSHPSAIPEILAAYERQVIRKDFTDRAEIDSWRLIVLNNLLSAADLLPHIRKAMAGEF